MNKHVPQKTLINLHSLHLVVSCPVLNFYVHDGLIPLFTISSTLTFLIEFYFPYPAPFIYLVFVTLKLLTILVVSLGGNTKKLKVASGYRDSNPGP